MQSLAKNQIESNYPTLARGLAWCVAICFISLLIAVIYLFRIVVHLSAKFPEIYSNNFSTLLQASAEYMFSPLGMFGVVVLSFIFVVPLMIFISQFDGQSWKTTLGFKGVNLKQIILSLIVFAILMLLSRVLIYYFPPPENEMLENFLGYHSVLLLFAFTFLGPISNEIFFRGYLFKVLRSSKLGAWGTIFIVALASSLITAHQHDLTTLLIFFVGGCYLTYIREKTQSIYIPMLLSVIYSGFFSVSLLYFEFV